MPEQNNETQKNTTSFLDKLYNILENEPNDVISWCKNGDSFIITDPELFSQTIMGKYFKTSKFNSFVRQLNFYGFRKVSRDSPSDDKTTSKSWEFKHPHFMKGRKDLLVKIHRKQVGENDPELDAKFESLNNEILSLKRQIAELQQWKESTQAAMNLYNMPREKNIRFDYDTLSLHDYDGLDKPIDPESFFDSNSFNPYTTWTNYTMPSPYTPSASMTESTGRFFPSNASVNSQATNESLATKNNGIKISLTPMNTPQAPTDIPVKIGNNSNGANANGSANMSGYGVNLQHNGSRSVPATNVPNASASLNAYAGYTDTAGYPDDYLNRMGYNRPHSN